MNAGAVIAARQNRYIRNFQEAGATSPERARTLEELGCRDSFVFRRLSARRVFVQSPDGRYHLDLAVAQAFRAQRRGRILLVLIGMLVVLAAVWWYSG